MSHNDLTKMHFLEHLRELRRRIFYMIAWLIGVFLILFVYSNNLFDWFAYPLVKQLSSNGKLIATEIASPFFVPITLALFAALLLTMPVILYNLWAFVAPALHRNEQWFARILLVSSWLLFYLGIAFCYYVVFPVIFSFIQKNSPLSISIMPDISHYLNFAFKMFLAFGCVFEVPVIIILLLASGVTTVEYLVSIRRHVIVGAFVIGMVLTPPDVISQIMLAIPIWMLYEVGILVWRLSRSKSIK